MSVTLEIKPLSGLQRTSVIDGPQNTLQWSWMQWLTTLFRMLAYIKFGTGTPLAVVSAPVGTIYLRLDGGVNTTLYVKEVGTDNLGWAAK